MRVAGWLFIVARCVRLFAVCCMMCVIGLWLMYAAFVVFCVLRVCVFVVCLLFVVLFVVCSALSFVRFGRCLLCAVWCV